MPVVHRVVNVSAVLTILLAGMPASASQPAPAPVQPTPAAAAQAAAAQAATAQTASSAAAQPTSPASAAPPAEELDPLAKLRQEFRAVDTAKGLAFDLSGDVLFEFNQAGLRAEAAPSLQKLADLIRLMKKPVRLSIYTDNKGNVDYDRKLTEYRAKMLKAALVQRGIRAATIQSAGYGQARPKAANVNPDGSDNPKGRDINRRVEVLIAKR